MPKIGLLISAIDTPKVWHSYIKAFKNALVTPVTYEQQPPSPGGAGGVNYDAALQQLLAKNVDLIVTAGNLAASACTKATQKPVVVASAGDFAGLTGNNWTGCTNGQINDAILQERVKRMMQQLKPTKVGVVGNDSVPPVSVSMNKVLALLPQNFASLLSLQQSDLQSVNTIRNKLSSLPNTVDVLYVCSDPLVRTHGGNFVTAAHGLNMKTMHEFCEWHTDHGGDLCYGPNFINLFQRAAGFVDQYFSTGTLPAVFNPGVPDCIQCP